MRNINTTIARFNHSNFRVEIFGQNVPTTLQNAYRHMLIEAAILDAKGTDFRKEIVKLKSVGYKTEPAFAKILKLEGDPFESLLKFNQADEHNK